MTTIPDFSPTDHGAPRFGRRVLLGMGIGASLYGLTRPVLAALPPARLRAAPAEANLLGKGEAATRVWSYDGATPGRLLRFRQGDMLDLTFENRLEEASSVHWHGLRVPNAMDGVPDLTQEAVPPGGDFRYTFPLEDAGTFWYHSHQNSDQQVARGLFGPLIIDEKEPPAVDQDVLLVLDDWRLDDDGQIDTASFGAMHDAAHGGRLGNVPTVNGGPSQDIPVKAGERVRLRLLNGANARVLLIRFPKHPVHIVAMDGMPLEPRDMGENPIPLAPGQRIDLMIDMGADPGTESPIEIAFGRQVVTIGRFLYDKQAVVRKNPSDAPIRLPDNPSFGAMATEGALRTTLTMQGGAMGGFPETITMDGKTVSPREMISAGLAWVLNGAVATMTKDPLFRVQPGRTAIIEVVNDNRWSHAMHSHGHHMKLLSIDGQPVANPPWRDTILVEAGERVELALIGGQPGKWAFHCHMLEHAAAGMMTWFEVG